MFSGWAPDRIRLRLGGVHSTSASAKSARSKTLCTGSTILFRCILHICFCVLQWEHDASVLSLGLGDCHELCAPVRPFYLFLFLFIYLFFSRAVVRVEGSGNVAAQHTDRPKGAAQWLLNQGAVPAVHKCCSLPANGAIIDVSYVCGGSGVPQPVTHHRTHLREVPAAS